MARFAIVGGGILGMTLALRLTKAGHRVTIYEAAAHCGGLAAPWELGDVTWDRHYHVTLFSDTHLRRLLSELALEEQLTWATTKTGFYVDGTMHSLSDVLDFVRFPPLSPVQKARLAYTILTASRIEDWHPLERITAVEWLTKLSGAATVERLWLPLLRAKLGPYAHHASAAFIWAVISRMYAARRSGAKRELFGYVDGGYDRVLNAFERRLLDIGVSLRLSEPVKSVRQRAGGIAVATGEHEEYYDEAVVTLAAPLAARVCPQLNDDERERCANVQYQGIICASLLADEPLTPYYITNITDAWVPFTAVIEMTNVVDRRAFGGRTLIYLPKYVPPGDPAFALSDNDIELQFLTALQRMHPRFSPASIRAFRISRVPYVMPVPTLRYSEMLPPMQTTVEHLYLVNSAHIVNGTLNVNETVKLAEAAAADLIDRSRRRHAGEEAVAG